MTVVVALAPSYLTPMRPVLAMLVAAALLAPALAHAQSNGDYTIMAPEPGHPEELPTPWLPPRYKSPRGSHNRVVPIPRQQPHYVRPVTPPPLVVPQTGQMVPQAPIISPSGPHGTETFQDKASRCVAQSSAPGAGNPGAYVGTCVNQ
ncbi:MAG TPA: hypothetical protein VG270_01540 [Pseudolabrys sp.]|nr:hypothetical protein [Pseudolabrys sp.]